MTIMQNDPGAPAGAAGQDEGNSLPIGTAENGPDARKAKSAVAALPLADIAARINEAYDRASEVGDRASALAQSAIEAAMEAGRLLIQAKDQVNHGGWLPWLEANTRVSERTAQIYMKLARDLHKSEVTADLTLDRALKLLSAPKADPKRQTAHNSSAASPKTCEVEVLPPKPKPPGSSPDLLTNENLVDRIRSDVEAAERRGIDIANLVLGPLALDPQNSVPPLPMSADPEAEINHSPTAVADGINTIKGTGNAGRADDTDELDVHYGPLTGREWIALSKCVDMRDPHDHEPGEPQYPTEFLRLIECFHVPIAQWRDRIMAGNARQLCLSQENDTDHGGGVK